MSATELKERLRADLKAAMRSRAAGEVRVLRVLVAALDNAEAVAVEPGEDEDRMSLRRVGDPGVEVERRALGAADVAALLAAEVEARREAAREYRQGGCEDEADALLAEIALIERYR